MDEVRLFKAIERDLSRMTLYEHRLECILLLSID